MTVGIDMLWTKMIKPELVDITPGSISLKQCPEELHLNHNGDMHAGVIFSMTEMAGMGVVVLLLGELANSSFVVVKNVNIDFIARAQGPITFSASIADDNQKSIIDRAKAEEKIEECVLVEAKDENGRLVSKSTLTAIISPHKR